MTIPGYCICKGQKYTESVRFPIFTPKHPKMGMNRHFSSKTRKILKLSYYRNFHIYSNQILDNDIDQRAFREWIAAILKIVWLHDFDKTV